MLMSKFRFGLPLHLQRRLARSHRVEKLGMSALIRAFHEDSVLCRFRSRSLGDCAGLLCLGRWVGRARLRIRSCFCCNCRLFLCISSVKEYQYIHPASHLLWSAQLRATITSLHDLQQSLADAKNTKLLVAQQQQKPLSVMERLRRSEVCPGRIDGATLLRVDMDESGGGSVEGGMKHKSVRGHDHTQRGRCSAVKPPPCPPHSSSWRPRSVIPRVQSTTKPEYRKTFVLIAVSLKIYALLAAFPSVPTMRTVRLALAPDTSSQLSLTNSGGTQLRR